MAQVCVVLGWGGEEVGFLGCFMILEKQIDRSTDDLNRRMIFGFFGGIKPRVNLLVIHFCCKSKLFGK